MTCASADHGDPCERPEACPVCEPAFVSQDVTLHHGDCLDVLRGLPDASVDAVVTDPPYGLEFMGKEWDRFDGGQQARWEGRKDTTERLARDGMGAATVGQRLTARPSFGKDSRGRRCLKCGHYKFSGTPCTCPDPEWEIRTGTPPHMRAFQEWCEAWAAEALRVLKPGGHMLAFGGTRTWHRLACAIEDAGFEIRPAIAWLYGSGFPKSLDVSKAIDKAAGALKHEGRGFTVAGRTDKNLPNPVVKGYVPPAPATPDAQQWQGWGTALKPAFEPIVVARKPLAGTVAANVLAHGTGALNVDGCRVGGESTIRTQRGTTKAWEGGAFSGSRENGSESGRWPANVVLDESQAAVLDEQSGETVSRSGGDGGTFFGEKLSGKEGDLRQARREGHSDTGGASRFFYVAKADASERVRVNGTAHPTVKPLALMRWLVRLVTPPGGTVLEPFAGSGTTVEACLLEGFRCIAIEREADYLPLIRQRIARRRDPVEAVKATGDDGGLFDLLNDEEAS